KELSCSSQLLLIVGSQRIAVIVEECVFDVLFKELFVGHGGRRWSGGYRSWTVHRHARCCLLLSAWTLCYPAIGCRIGRRNTLRSTWIHSANAFNADISCVFSCPGKLGRLSRFHRGWISRQRCCGRWWRWGWRRWRRRWFLLAARNDENGG